MTFRKYWGVTRSLFLLLIAFFCPSSWGSVVQLFDGLWWFYSGLASFCSSVCGLGRRGLLFLPYSVTERLGVACPWVVTVTVSLSFFVVSSAVMWSDVFVVVLCSWLSCVVGSVFVLSCLFLFCFQENEVGGGSIRILVVVNLKSGFSRFKIWFHYVLIHLYGTRQMLLERVWCVVAPCWR